jgi:hypothetical protein
MSRACSPAHAPQKEFIVKALLSATLLTTVGFSSNAMAQLSTRCFVDDVLVNTSVATGRNAWARRCGFITAAKEAFLNSESEYQVFLDGCYTYPNVVPLSSCYRHVPVSEWEACIPLGNLSKLGTCPISYSLAAPKATPEEPRGDEVGSPSMASSHPRSSWTDLHHRLRLRDEADVQGL